LEFLKAIHGCLLPYKDLHIVTTVVTGQFLKKSSPLLLRLLYENTCLFYFFFFSIKTFKCTTPKDEFLIILHANSLIMAI